ncbi:hypothetical protein ANCDUO_07198 [Ancylostoma duodenale]|uniref:Uncharacterized protein n=1 Tax=Ancylostoma duodenale TaxID=51022 RepID=A0A0C2GZF9_9BILA|nr:hypothetical protein ANCDUO_07198 [Ancylostoma duodenale]
MSLAPPKHALSFFVGKSNGIGSASEKESTKSDGEDSAVTTKKKLERKTSLPTEDEKTTSLIRKQMSEIEKEITRRSQNKNIKKLVFSQRAATKGPNQQRHPAIAVRCKWAATLSKHNYVEVYMDLSEYKKGGN